MEDGAIGRLTVSLERPGPLVRSLLALCFVAAILLLGTTASEPLPAIRLLGAVVGGVLVVAWVTAVQRQADLLDHATTAALVAFSTSCVLSIFPRQAFDAAIMALVWTSALGVGRRVLGTEQMRAYALVVLAAVGIVLGVSIAFAWGRIWLDWLSLTGWQGIPPLDLALPSGPWAHQHDLTSLLVMLAPAIWLKRGTGLQRVLQTGVLACIGAAVVMDGSRSVWLALVVATGVTLLRPLVRVLSTHRRIAVAVGAGVCVVVLAAILVGFADEVVRRLTATRSIDWRTAQWSSALSQWTEHPIQGAGPGSFPFLLRLTDYFDSHTFVSRHPDNAAVQLIAEAGLLGVLAVAVVLSGVVRMWRRGSAGSGAAAWVLIYALVVSVGTNPFEYGFLLAPLVVWTSLGTFIPAGKVVDGSRPLRARSLTPAIMTAIGILALAQTATVAATFAYDGGSRAAGQGSYTDAREMLDLAVMLDPGMALYVRERGAMALISGMPHAAAIDLTAATARNPADDVPHRLLADAWLARGDPARALAAARAAVRRDASDPRNQIMLARAAQVYGDSESATRALAMAVLHGPWMTADPIWGSLLQAEQTTTDILDAAVEIWRDGHAPWLDGLEPAWLVGLADSRQLTHQAAMEAGALGPSAAALFQVLTCATQREGLGALRSLERSQRIFGEYWRARVISEALAGTRVDGSLAETAILRMGQLERAIADRSEASDLYSGGFKDQYGYHRRPIKHLGGPVAPSAWDGIAEWINRPVRAALAAGLTEPVAACRP